MTTPKANHNAMYEPVNSATDKGSLRRMRPYMRTMGAAAGNIMATIIATHMARNSGHDLPIVRSGPMARPMPMGWRAWRKTIHPARRGRAA